MSETFFHLFTYGTLMAREGEPPELLAGCERVGDATVRGTLYDTGPYPALLLGGTDRVQGELWRCPGDALARIDRYEAVAERLFRRVALRVEETPSWTYVAGPRLGDRLTPDRRIPSGRWVRGAQRREPTWR